MTFHLMKSPQVQRTDRLLPSTSPFPRWPQQKLLSGLGINTPGETDDARRLSSPGAGYPPPLGWLESEVLLIYRQAEGLLYGFSRPPGTQNFAFLTEPIPTKQTNQSRTPEGSGLFSSLKEMSEQYISHWVWLKNAGPREPLHREMSVWIKDSVIYPNCSESWVGPDSDPHFSSHQHPLCKRLQL